jgi:pimeloyl-ACP methyl ester carboxylesterase
MERKVLHPDGIPLAYRASGSGPAVVLLHGFGEDGEVWTDQRDCFPGCRLLIPDLPGSGLSAMRSDMSLEALADALLPVLDVESVSTFTLIGHSMGGYIALAFAERYPGRLAGLGLFHSSAFADSEEKKETRRKGIDFIESNGANAFLRTSIPNLFSAATKRAKPELVAGQVRRNEDFTDAALVAYYRSMMERADRTEVLRTIPVPVLFVLGREDGAVPISDGLQQCYLPARAQVEILEESGHMGMMEEAGKANQMLNSFVNWVLKPLKTS